MSDNKGGDDMALDEISTVLFCSSGHSQISYMTEHCPLCKLVEEFNERFGELERELNELRNEQ